MAETKTSLITAGDIDQYFSKRYNSQTSRYNSLFAEILATNGSLANDLKLLGYDIIDGQGETIDDIYFKSRINQELSQIDQIDNSTVIKTDNPDFSSIGGYGLSGSNTIAGYGQYSTSSSGDYQESTVADDSISTLKDVKEYVAGTTLETIDNLINKVKDSIGNSKVFSNIVDTITTVADQIGKATGYSEDRDVFGDKKRKSKTAWNSGNHIAISDTASPFNPDNSIFGSLIFGTPPLQSGVSDPQNRTMANTFGKDFKFLSLTPGLPKFNGSQQAREMYGSSSFASLTPTYQEQLSYIKQNGLGKNFSQNDLRYYIFDQKFDQYYEYLETMLNVLWIKLGLSDDSNNRLTLHENLSNITKKNSLGFYTNPTGRLAESIDNSESSTGSALESKVNSAGDSYQELHYLTGMGTADNSFYGSILKIGTGIRTVQNQISQVSSDIIQPITSGVVDAYDTAKGYANVIPIFGKVAGVVAGIAAGVGKLVANTLVVGSSSDVTSDIGSTIQAISNTNGMRVKYPNLWGDSNYTKSVNFDFDFSSPYGDPLSLFNYVYLPFFALLTFCLPRQVDYNGLISPFFVRADIPGLFTTDLGIVSNMTWTKGGESGNLWTKDGLPRAIHCSITIQDLYPFLAMTSHISMMSSNPSYTSFLDNMSGIGALYTNDQPSQLESYYKDLLNRVNSETSTSGLKNNRGNLYIKAKDKNYINELKNGFGNRSSTLTHFTKR